MYAIDYDFEQGLSEKCDFTTYSTMITKIKKVLNDYGFSKHSASFYIGANNIDAVSAFRCVMALNELTKSSVCMQGSLKDVRVIQINKDSLPEIREKV